MCRGVCSRAKSSVSIVVHGEALVLIVSGRPDRTVPGRSGLVRWCTSEKISPLIVVPARRAQYPRNVDVLQDRTSRSGVGTL